MKYLIFALLALANNVNAIGPGQSGGGGGGGSDSTKVLKAGDTMTGSLDISGSASTLTVQGNAFSVGASTFVVANGRIGIGKTDPLQKMHMSSGTFTMDGTSNNLRVIGGTITVTLGGISVLGGGVQTEHYGDLSQAVGTQSTAVGYNASSVFRAAALGTASSASGAGCIAIGYTSSCAGDSAVSIGNTTTGPNSNSVAIGNSADAGGSSIAIGANADTLSGGQSGGVAIGNSAIAYCDGCLSVGPSNVSGNGATFTISFGQNSTANHNDSIAFGNFVKTNDTSQLVFAAPAHPINDVYFGQGQFATSPTGYTIHGSSGSGTNIAGGNVTLAAGEGTGTAYGGSLIFKTSPVSQTSGVVPNALATRLIINTTGYVGIGTTTPTSLLEVSGTFKPWPRTKAQIDALIPLSVGEYIDCTDCTIPGLCRSTGTAVAQWRKVESATAGCGTNN